jgi:hypothetical protein
VEVEHADEIVNRLSFTAEENVVIGSAERVPARAKAVGTPAEVLVGFQ